MFRFLQVVVTVILLAGVMLLFRKRSRALVTGLSVVLLLASVCSGAVIAAIPLPAESVRIEAAGEKNPAAQGNIVGIRSYIAAGKEHSVEPAGGTWFYSKEDGAFLWLNEGDERITEPLTEEITIEVPIGAGRRLVFLTGSQYGVVRVSDNHKSETYDLYRDAAGTQKIRIADSDRTYVVLIKLCRLAGYGLLIIAALALALFLANIMAREDLTKLICMILSIISTLTFFINPGLTKRSGSGLFALLLDFNRSFPAGNFLLPLLLVPLLYKMFLHCEEIYRQKYASAKGTLCISLPAGLFAVFMVIGAAFINGENTLRPIFENELQILKSLFAATGYFSMFFFGIVWIFNYLDCVDIYKVSDKKHLRPVQLYLERLKKYPFRTTFATLIILYIPYIVINYPGIFMGDTRHHLYQIYGMWELNNAHPIMSTLLLKFCVETGTFLFHSENAGVFLYGILQFTFIISIVSLVVKWLFSWNISQKIPLLLIAYYAFHPRVQYWMLLLTKDILNAVFLLLLMLALYMIFTGKPNSYVYIALGLGDLGAILFRNDSQYVILISLVLIFITVKGFRRVITITAACTLCFVIIWNSALAHFDIPPANPGKNVDFGILTSIMFQQTARYIRDAGNEVTDEEREIIDAVLDVKEIVSKYQPDDRSDGVAKVIRQSSATPEDVEAYKRVWFQMFFKHPEIYLEATLNHKYQYLYPSTFKTYYYAYSSSGATMDEVNGKINKYLGKDAVNFSYPDLGDLNVRGAYQNLREAFFRSPVFNLLYTTSSYFWLLFIWLAYCVWRRDRTAIAVMMPLLVLILVLIAGPCNGMYFRYSYPYALCLPILIILGLHNMKQQELLTSSH